MDLKTIEGIIQKGESATCELKKTTAPLNHIGETLCGFLNGNGGQVVVGVLADGKIVGLHVTDNTLREIAMMLAKLEPTHNIEIERVALHDQKEVLVLTARPLPAYKPFVFEGCPYERVGSTTSRMLHTTYQRLILEKNHGNHRWESEPAVGYTIDDLDHQEILRTIRLGLEAGRLPEGIGSNIPDVLDKLQVRKDGVLLNAAMVLFGKKFIDYPQCLLRVARFRGRDKTEFIDQNRFVGHAFQLLEEVQLFLRRHVPVAGKIVSHTFERQDTPLFPHKALREALVNALCHRTYTRPGGSIALAIFDDRLEIWSDGELPFNVTCETLKHDHNSQPRNPIITNVFYRRGLIEQWGRGTQKIVALCVKGNCPEPEFFENSGSLVVRFFPSRGGVSEEDEEDGEGDVIRERKRDSEKGGKEVVQAKVGPTIEVSLSERQSQIIRILAQADEMSLAEVRNNIKDPPTQRTLQIDMQRLKQLGIVSTTTHGRGKGTKWILTGIHKINN